MSAKIIKSNSFVIVEARASEHRALLDSLDLGQSHCFHPCELHNSSESLSDGCYCHHKENRSDHARYRVLGR